MGKLYWASTLAGAAVFSAMMLLTVIVIGSATGSFAGGVFGYVTDPNVVSCSLTSIPLVALWVAWTDQFTCKLAKACPGSEPTKDGVSFAASVASIGLVFFLPVATTGGAANAITMTVAVGCGFVAGYVRGWVFDAGGGNQAPPDVGAFA